jgi:hypothetical protein
MESARCDQSCTGAIALCRIREHVPMQGYQLTFASVENALVAVSDSRRDTAWNRRARRRRRRSRSEVLGARPWV